MSNKKSLKSAPDAFSDLLTPISPEQPCGPNLEYDPEFILLFAKASTQPEAQYGNFIGTQETVNWAEIERDSQRLLLRSRDIRVLILLLRCKIQQAGGPGLQKGLELLWRLIETYPEHIHPQIILEEDSTEEEAALTRGNALAALCDPEGVLSDLRSIVLSHSSATRLQVRDVERSFAIPKPADALAPDSVRRQLQDLRLQGHPTLAAFETSLPFIESLQTWANDSLHGAAPDLTSLKKLVIQVVKDEGRFSAAPMPQATQAAPKAGEDKNFPTTANSVPPPHDSGISFASEPVIESFKIISSRFEALEQIQKARTWFENNEPSSPTIPLLRQAERMVGKRFSEVVDAIPLELLQKWDAEE